MDSVYVWPLMARIFSFKSSDITFFQSSHITRSYILQNYPLLLGENDVVGESFCSHVPKTLAWNAKPFLYRATLTAIWCICTAPKFFEFRNKNFGMRHFNVRIFFNCLCSFCLLYFACMFSQQFVLIPIFFKLSVLLLDPYY